MPRHKRDKRPFHRINHSLLNAQIGRKNNAFPLPPLFITSANLFYREVKLFLSREQTFVITMKNTNSPFFKSNNLILRTKSPTLCTTKQRTSPAKTNTEKGQKQAVSSHIKPYFLQNNLHAAIQPTGRNEKWRTNQKKAFHSRL